MSPGSDVHLLTAANRAQNAIRPRVVLFPIFSVADKKLLDPDLWGKGLLMVFHKFLENREFQR